MSILDKVRGYQRQAATVMQPEAIQQQAQQEQQQAISPAGATLPPDKIPEFLAYLEKFLDTEIPILPGKSFLQSCVLFGIQQMHLPVPVDKLKHVPVIGAPFDKFLSGDPYEAHTLAANTSYIIERLLERDKEWDPVVLARKQAYAEAEARANERNRASAVTTASGPVHDFGQDWKRKIDAAGPPLTAIPESLPDEPGVDHRQQAEIQSSMEYGRPEREQTL